MKQVRRFKLPKCEVSVWRCDQCGGMDSLYHEASVYWSAAKQKWEVNDVRDGQYCTECQEEVQCAHEDFDQIYLWYDEKYAPYWYERLAP